MLQGASRNELSAKVCAVYDAIYADPSLAAEYQRGLRLLPDASGSRPTSTGGARTAGACTACWASRSGEKDKMHAQHRRNFRFFDAPVGLMFTIDRILGRGSLLDYGMFLQTLMLAARAQGLHTCPQAAWNGFSKIVLPHVGAGAGEMLVCGMSLGYADESQPVNGLDTPREPVGTFTRWLD